MSDDEMIRTKAALLEFMRANPTMVLEYCRGVTSSGWWWMRTGKTPHTVRVHAAAAHGLRDTEKILEPVERDFNSYSYRLKPGAK